MDQKVKQALNYLKEKYPSISYFLNKLQQTGPTAIVGGAVRDWILDYNPRDLDITVDCQPEILNEFLKDYSYETNHFGGFKLILDNQKIDLWPLNKTWAFNHASIDPTFKNWLQTPFFNLDSLLYILNTETLLIDHFTDSIKTKTLGILFKDNPAPMLCFYKAMLHRQKYGLSFSEKLIQFLDQKIRNSKRPFTLSYLKKNYETIFKKDFQAELLNTLPEDIRVLIINDNSSVGEN